MKRLILITGILLISANLLTADDRIKSEAVKARDTRMKWWREARFGMFVHWGLYSIPAGQWEDKNWVSGNAEWIQQRASIPAAIYEEELIPQFKPKAGFAEEWAEIAKLAGCRYLVFTSKHHEGFALHDSKLTTFDAMDTCGRDLFKEIVDATRAEGLRVGAYHSIIDWHHPDAYAGAEFGIPFVKGTSNKGRDNSNYLDYLHGQVKEIMSGYGPIDIVWWDYSKEQCQGESWRAKELVAMVREYQPNIIMNNRLYRSPEAGYPKGNDWSAGFSIDPQYGDFCTPEQRIPPNGVEGVDWESCMTMNTTWGYNQFDHDWKSTETLIRNLVDVVSKGGNYLLNVGPKADGSIPKESIERMKAIGTWMEMNGDAIYGTHASPFGKPDWGRYTTKPGKIYAHVFEWPKKGTLRIETKGLQVGRAYLLADKTQRDLKLKVNQNDVLVHLPEKAPDDIVSVIVIEDESRNAVQQFQSDADIIRLEHILYWSGLIEEYYEQKGAYPLQNQLDENGVAILVKIATRLQRQFISPGSRDYNAELDLNVNGTFQELPVRSFIAELEDGLGREIKERYDIQKDPPVSPIGYSYFTTPDGYMILCICPTYGVSKISTLFMDRFSPAVKIVSPGMKAKVTNSLTRQELMEHPIFHAWRQRKLTEENESYVRQRIVENEQDSKKP